MSKYQLVDPGAKYDCSCFSPLDPRPLLLPSNFDYDSWKPPITIMKRSEPTHTTPPQKIVSFDRVYGPSSRGKASLRYYGNGPY